MAPTPCELSILARTPAQAVQCAWRSIETVSLSPGLATIGDWSVALLAALAALALVVTAFRLGAEA